MPKHQFPPKGYNQMEYPLPHKFDYKFELSPETAATNSTICSLIQCREGLTAIETIEVNPANTAFAEETGPVNAPNSIIPRMNVSIDAQLNRSLTETDRIKFLKINYMPIYISFVDSLTAMDYKTDTEIEDILELEHVVASKTVIPTFNSTDLLLAGNHPLNTVHIAEAFTGWGLTTDAKMEGVSFDSELMWDALAYYSNSGMLSKVMGNWRTALVTEHKPFHFSSNNYTNPSVKRMNEYTYCGILFHVPLVDTPRQYYDSTDITEASSAVRFNVRVRYDEWNSQFNQTNA